MRFILNEEQYNLVKKYVVPILETSTKLIFDNDNLSIKAYSMSDLEDFIISADEAIIQFGMVNQDYLTELGCKLQWLYDELIYQKHNQNQEI